MKQLVSSLAYAIVFTGLTSALQQATFDIQWLTTLLQIPMVAGLIVLVLKLEDKRQASAMVREETFRSVVDSLLGVIVELSSMANPGKINSEQIKNIEKYLSSQREQGR